MKKNLNKVKLTFLFFLLMMVASAVSYAQSGRITGKVTGEDGAGLPGVAILIQGTTQGTVTDFDGNYVLTSVPENAILVFSFMGMKNQEIRIQHPE